MYIGEMFIWLSFQYILKSVMPILFFLWPLNIMATLANRDKMCFSSSTAGALEISFPWDISLTISSYRYVPSR